MYDEYLRMNQEAVGTDYYRQIGNEGNSNSKEVDQKLESLEHEVASALNFAKAQLPNLFPKARISNEFCQLLIILVRFK
jgi:hypothetical protein